MDRIFENKDFDDAYQNVLEMGTTVILKREAERTGEIFEIQGTLIITVDFINRQFHAISREDNPWEYAAFKKQFSSLKPLIPDLNLKFIDCLT